MYVIGTGVSMYVIGAEYGMYVIGAELGSTSDPGCDINAEFFGLYFGLDLF